MTKTNRTTWAAWALLSVLALGGPGLLTRAIVLASGLDGEEGDAAAHSKAVPVMRQAIAPPVVKLGRVPTIQLDTPSPVSRREAAQIERLIADLAKIDTPDFGLSPTLSGQAFAPIAGSQQVYTLLLGNHQIKSAEAVRKLVEIGPRALPFLLKSLSDRAPTRLTIGRRTSIGFLWFDNEMWGNPLNDVEQRALASLVKTVPDLRASIPSYTVTVGDVCFVIIGQIVGRPYCAVRYQPSLIVVINSPTRDASIARQVRAIWASEDPSQHLLDSLLFDYATEGIFNGSSLDGWDIGSNLQINAAMRLLY